MGEPFAQLPELPPDVSLTPCENVDLTVYHPLDLTSAQKASVGALYQQIPTLLASNSMSGAYMLKFPEGINGHLMKLKIGGYASTIQGPGGVIQGTASLYPMQTQAAMLGAFSVLSTATGQYFLSEIHGELSSMNQRLDKILEFLYGDKKAELIAEVSFARYAYRNYISIMERDEQRIATIASLQESRKVAMKDLEFYMNDLDSLTKTKGHPDIAELVENAFRTKECLELAMQLYVMSNLLEVYYSRNNDPDYLHYIRDDASLYVDKCGKHMLGDFSALRVMVETYKDGFGKKIDKVPLTKKLDGAVEELHAGGSSPMMKALDSALNSAAKTPEYCLTKDGKVYLKAA